MCEPQNESESVGKKKSVAYFLGRRDRKQLVVSTHCAGRLSALLPLGNCLQTVFVCVSVYKYLCVCVCVQSGREFYAPFWTRGTCTVGFINLPFVQTIQFKQRWIEMAKGKKESVDREGEDSVAIGPPGIAPHMPIFCHFAICQGSARVKMQPNCRGSNFYEPLR